MKDLKLSVVLAGGLVSLLLLWVTFAPETVTRAEMQSYVMVTATEHLRILREDMSRATSKLGEVCERLSAVEAVVRERK